MHQLTRIQRFPIRIAEAWDFFSSPRNLAKITPPGMGFDILSSLPEKMHPGMTIAYRVKPLFGIPLTWVTEISHVNEPYYFVDTQLSGPYRIWHHQHLFREIDGGTEMKDLVDYSLPGGPFGKIAHVILVKKKLESIFDYRHRILEERFGEINQSKKP